MKKANNSLFAFIIMLLLIISEIFMSKSLIFRYFDEIVASFFAIYIIISFFKKKISSDFVKKMLFCCILILIIGLLSSIISRQQISIMAILLDIVAMFKLPTTLIGFSLLLKNDDTDLIIQKFLPISKIFLNISLICGVISLFFNIGMRGQYRFGLWGFNFIFGYGHIFSLLILFSLLIITQGENKNKNKVKYYTTISSIILLMTLKGPSLITAVLLLFFPLFIKHAGKIKIIHIVFLIIISLILGNYQIKTYFMKENAPRYILLKYGIETANDYFPLGAGFASYGSDMAAKNYSKLYTKYGFSTLYGMNPYDYKFLNDNYWPSIIGQFGYIGGIIVLTMLIMLFNYLQNLDIKYKLKSLLLTCYMYTIISSIGNTIFTTSATTIMMIGMVLIIIKYRNNGSEKMKVLSDRGGLKQSLIRALKKHDLFYKIICSVFMKFGFSNIELQALEIRNKKFKKLQKKYNKYLKNIDYDNKSSKVKYDDVWVCWFQGIENVPEIVKVCIDSIQKQFSNKKVHIITSDNMFEYVKLPNNIISKWKSGVISYAHLSDIIRTELLIKYGGLWIDATTYVTGNIPEYIYSKNLFLLEFKTREDLTIRKNSWFIYSKKDNRTLKITRDLIYKYWENEKYLSEYFLWHMFVEMAFQKYPEDYNDIYYVSEEMSHFLLYNFFNKYDEKYWNEIKKFSNIHKLSYYKFFTNDTKMPDNVKGTFYEKFINGKLN